MPYLIETFDKPDSHELRLSMRPKHLEFLAEHAASLLACGAKLSDDGERASGGIYLVAVESREAAEGFIAGDPFTKAELFERVEISRWRQAYLDGKCWL